MAHTDAPEPADPAEADAAATTKTPESPQPRVEAPGAADERTMLTAWLDWHRSTVWEKCAGLTADHGRAAPLATSPLMTVGGIVSHLRWVEHYWFEARLLGLPDQGPYTAADPDADWRPDAGRTLPELLEDYAAQCLNSRANTARLELGNTERSPARPARTLRWVLVQMIQETARHNGHLDLIREMVDGSTGE